MFHISDESMRKMLPQLINSKTCAIRTCKKPKSEWKGNRSTLVCPDCRKKIEEYQMFRAPELNSLKLSESNSDMIEYQDFQEFDSKYETELFMSKWKTEPNE